MEVLGETKYTYENTIDKPIEMKEVKIGDYFSTLLDSLQFWNRDSRINQAEYMIPYTTYNKSLNIEIRDNKIRITESDRRLDINQAVKRRRDCLDDYLEEASGYIELSLSDF